jgi:hypothetical protein
MAHTLLPLQIGQVSKSQLLYIVLLFVTWTRQDEQS